VGGRRGSIPGAQPLVHVLHWRFGLGRPLETPGAQAAAVTSLLLIAQQVAGKAARDALFLSSFHASHLPTAMAAGAILSLAAAYWVSRLMARHAPATIMLLLCATSASGFTLEWALDLSAPRVAAVLVYLQTALVGPVIISTFWALINERFDPHTAKRAVARIAGGGTLGGVLGGLAAWRASSLVQPGTVLLFLAALNALAIGGTLLTRARKEAAPASVADTAPAETVSPFVVLRAEPFLRNLAVLIALGAALSALLDYIFSAQAAAAFGKGQPLLSFFSLFWLAVGVLSFLLQISLGRVALEKLGLAVSIAVLPGIIILGGAFGLAMPGLLSASLLRGAEAVQRNTLFRSAYELLYTPLPEERKRATKAFIDVGFDRLGTFVGSGVALIGLYAFARGQGTFLLGAVVVLAIATLPVARQIHVGYLAALQQGLRDGAKKLEVSHDRDAASRHSLAPQHVDREKLIERIEVMQPGGLTALLEATSVQPASLEAPGRALAALKKPEALLSSARDVLFAQSERLQHALESLDARGPAVACAILLLAHAEHHERALQALRRSAASITGQLIDALLDPTMDFVVRRRLPRALNQCLTQRAADGLLLGIGDERFEVRYACGRALLRVSDGDPQLSISREKVMEAVKRELDSEKRMLEGTSAEFEEDPGADAESSLLDGLRRDRVTRSLEHVFTILSLHLEREPLRMAFRALYHEDTRYRGTALEYLDTVLPGEIREILWPYLGAAAPLTTARAAHELLADLARVGEVS